MSNYRLIDWICSPDNTGPTLPPVPAGSGVSDQVLGHTRWNWQTDLDSGARKALPLWHHEADRHWYCRHKENTCCDEGKDEAGTLYICRKQRVHQSGSGSETSRNAAGLLPAGSWAWLVSGWEWFFPSHLLTVVVVSHCFCLCKVGSS